MSPLPRVLRLPIWLVLMSLMRVAAPAGDPDCTCTGAPTCYAKEPNNQNHVDRCANGDPTNNGTTSESDQHKTKSKCEEIKVDDKSICKYTETDWSKWEKSKMNANSVECCDKYYATPKCQLLAGALGWSLQVLLVLAGFGSLLLKKWVEEAKTDAPPRDYKTWSLDVSKQAASMGCAHVAGMINATILHHTNDPRTDRCSWYSISFTFDTTLGVLFGYALFSLSGYFAKNSDRPTCAALSKSGQYINPMTKRINYTVWGVQLAVWCLITIMSRMMVLCTLLLIHSQVEEVAAFIALRFACQPDLLLVYVMIGCPIGMNIMQLWIQDQFLKAQDDAVPGAQLYVAAEINRRTTDPMVRSSLRESLLGVEEQQDTALEALEGGRAKKKKKKAVNGNTKRKREMKEYKKLQKKCCNACLVVLFVIFIVVPVLRYGVVLSESQAAFDHCYSQVRNNDPAVLKALKGQERINIGISSGFDGYPDDVTANTKHKRFHNFSEAYGGCDHEKSDSLRKQVESNDLAVPWTDGEPNRGNTMLPLCMCCSHKDKRRWSKEPNATNATDWACNKENGRKLKCPQIGECCHRSSLLQPNLDLKKKCAVCSVYNPCDQKRCAARPDTIRNAQHNGLTVGLVLSFLGNGYVVYTYFFEHTLRQATITRLLVCVAGLQLVFCVTLLLQEASFRIPNSPCTDLASCPEPSTWFSWPTWDRVAKSYYGTQRVSDTVSPDFRVPGQRGQAVNWCQPVSFIVQFTFTASDFYYLMIAMDLLLNLYGLPFGDTEKRMYVFHGITWTISIVLAVALMFSGDWGVSHDSLLEDFCWNVNFGRPGSRNEYSNWPHFQVLVYFVSILGYLISGCIAGIAQLKIKDLSPGQKEARGPEINQGTIVVFVSALWLILWALFYNVIIIGNESLKIQGHTEDIIKSLNVYPKRQIPVRSHENQPLFMVDYRDPKDSLIVSIWSFLVGARNLMNYFIFRFIVLPRLNAEYAENLLTDALNGIGMGGGGSSGGRKKGGVEERPLKKVLQNELLFFTGLGIRGALRVNDGADLGMNFSTSRDAGGLYGSPSNIGLGVTDNTEKNILLDSANNYEKAHKTEFFDSFNQIFSPGEETVRRMTEETLRTTDDETVKAMAERNSHLTQYKFRTYRPKEFRELRELFNIDKVGEVGANSLLHKAMEAHQEGSFTGGASGSFMYFSGDKRFIVKQITHEEMLVLLEILPAYKKHMEDSIDQDSASPTKGQCKSLLLRIVQCNRIKMYHSTSRVIGKCLQGRVYFMVFENLLWSRLHSEQAKNHALEAAAAGAKEGQRIAAASKSISSAPTTSVLESSLEASLSLSNRATVSVVRAPSNRNINVESAGTVADQVALTERTLERERPLELYDLKGSWVNRSTPPQPEGAKKRTMKDNDLREKIYLQRRERIALIEQIENDSKFLCDRNIMDYSLLLGIEKGVNPQVFEEVENNTQVLHARFANSASVYYVGIIDMLQKWNWSKKAERLVKALMGKDLDGVSSEKPELYQKRFVEEMSNHIYRDELDEGQQPPQNLVQHSGHAVAVPTRTMATVPAPVRTMATVPAPVRTMATASAAGSDQWSSTYPTGSE